MLKSDSTRKERIAKYRQAQSQGGLSRLEVYVSDETKELLGKIGKLELMAVGHLGGLLLEQGTKKYWEEINGQMPGNTSKDEQVIEACAGLRIPDSTQTALTEELTTDTAAALASASGHGLEEFPARGASLRAYPNALIASGGAAVGASSLTGLTGLTGLTSLQGLPDPKGLGGSASFKDSFEHGRIVRESRLNKSLEIPLANAVANGYVNGTREKAKDTETKQTPKTAEIEKPLGPLEEFFRKNANRGSRGSKGK